MANMKPIEALHFLEQGATNEFTFPVQATKAYHKQVQQALKILVGLIEATTQAEAPPADSQASSSSASPAEKLSCT